MTTRFPGGLTTAKKSEPLGEFILPDFTKAHVYFEDFDYYNANDWTVTEVGVATQTLADEDGGVLLITNAGADNDSSFSNKVGESFFFEQGKKIWFEARLKVSEATQSAWAVGLQITSTNPLNVTDGVFFRKDDGNAEIDFQVEKNGSVSTVTNVHENVDDTFVRLAFYYNGLDKVCAFVDGSAVAAVDTTNLPDDEVMTISYGIQNGDANARTMSIDYILAAKER